MNKISVVLENGLSEQQLHRVVEAITQIKGVAGLEQAPNFTPPAQGSPIEDKLGGGMTFNQEGVFTENVKPMSDDTQRKFIRSTIKWGIRNGQISLNELETMTPEQTVKLAFSLTDKMSDTDKKNLAEEIQAGLG